MAEKLTAKQNDLADLLASLPECMGADFDAVCAPGRHNDLACTDVVETAERMGIDFAMAPFSVEDLHLGMAVEADQRGVAPDDLLDEDLLEIGKVAMYNLQRQSDFYTQLTAAHAPGDPVPAGYHLADVGTD